MIKKRLTRRIGVEFMTPSDLSPEDRELVRQAWSVRGKASAPYSHFRVGAAVRSARGGVYVGCNVEVCTYSQTTHAEQAAIAAMVSAEGPRARVVAIAIAAAPGKCSIIDPMLTDGFTDAAAVDDLNRAAVPCGHCLQIINEMAAGPEMCIIGYHPDGLVSVVTLCDTLPFALKPADIV